MSESWIEGEIKAAIDEEYRPAPWLLANSIAAVRGSRPARPVWAWVAGVVAILLAVGSIAVFESLRLTQKSHTAPGNASTTASSTRTTANPSTPATVGSIPSMRGGAALVWDAKDHYMLMFGGATTAPDGRTFTPNDTWAWTDHQWKLMNTSIAPPGRSFPAMAYDPIRQEVVMYGGGMTNSDEFRTDTWAWDGVEWKELHPTSSPGRGYVRMAYDPEQRALILVRQPISPAPVETWSWTGTTWMLAASGSTPSPRWFSSLCNDPVTGEVLLVGGYLGPLGDHNARKSETFVWHKGAWLQKQTGQPSPSGYVAASLDEKRHEVVLFALWGNETWTFDGSRWTRHMSAPVLEFTALGFDSSTGMVLLFGGKTDSSLSTRYVDELWEWDGGDWIRL